MTQYRSAVIGLGRTGKAYDDKVEFGRTVYTASFYDPGYFF